MLLRDVKGDWNISKNLTLYRQLQLTSGRRNGLIECWLNTSYELVIITLLLDWPSILI